MWRDQVNYFTRQIIKCFFFLFSLFLFFFGQGQKGEWWGGSVQDPGVIFMKKIFLKLILCQNVFCKCSTHAMYLKQKLIRTYFHMWLCILPLRGQTWFLFVFGIGHQPSCYYSAFYIMKLYPHFEGTMYCRGCISVCILVLRVPDVVLYCPLLSENHPHI